jgi:hypothetical protein
LKAGKKGKKHNPSSRQGVQSLCQQHHKEKKRTCYWLFGPFFRESGIVFSRLHLEAVKNKSIQLILSENVLALCNNNY